MIRVRLIACICLVTIFRSIFADIELQDPGYENTILQIDEYETPSSNKIVITFQESDPICLYAPQNFEESLDDTVYRAFMPRTTVAEDVETSLELDDDPGGVEILVTGASIKKYMGQDHVMFVVKK